MQRLVLIPVHNEQGTIGLLVRQCRQLDFSVWVIDDGSSDDSAALALAEGAHVLANPPACRGKTAALRLALSQIPPETEWIFIMDGDGQHQAADLPRFYAERDEADLVVGDRLPDGKSMPFLRRSTNHLMSWLLRALFRSPVRDSQCGFRMIRARWLAGWLPRGNRFEFETEVSLLATRRPTRVKNLGIAALYAGEVSKIRPWRDAVNFVRILLKR